MSDSGSPVFVHLVTGYLGSGKTTLLNTLLARPAFVGSALVVSEFGDIAVDHVLLRYGDRQVVLLENGCVCCSAAAGLVGALSGLMNGRRRGTLDFSQVIVECSGLSRPMPVLQSILLLGSRGLRLGWTLATVDAVHGASCLAREVTAREQVELADYVLVTKTDLVASGQVRQVVDRVRRLNAGIVATSSSSIGNVPDWHGVDISAPRLPKWRPPRIPRTNATEDALHPGAPDRLPTPHEDIVNASIQSDQAISWSRLADWLQRLLAIDGDVLLRIKGIVWLEEHPHAMALHAIHDRLYPLVPLAESEGAQPRARVSRLVFIGRGLDPDALRAGFSAQVVPVIPARG